MNNWITDRNPNDSEFLKAYVRAFMEQSLL